MSNSVPIDIIYQIASRIGLSGTVSSIISGEQAVFNSGVITYTYSGNTAYLSGVSANVISGNIITVSGIMATFVSGGYGVFTSSVETRGEVNIFGTANSGGRITLRSVYSGSPSNPLSGMADFIIVDNGITPVFRVRYNNGTMKVGDVALV